MNVSRDAAIRGLVLVLLALLAVAAIRNAFGLSQSASPSALTVDPGSALVLARAAIDRAPNDRTDADRAITRDLAIRAIRRDPTSAVALTALGYATPAPQAARIMAASEALSRRNLYTQLWLIEDAVQRDDADTALHHYDIALRTSKQAPSILFAVLVDAVSDPSLVPAIARRLALRPSWGPLYLQQLAQSGSALPDIARLFTMLRRRGVDPGDPALAALYPRLVAAKQYDAAWAVYAAGAPGARRDAVRTRAVAGTPSPFDWTPADVDTANVQIDSTTLTYASVTDGGGVAARQLLLLPAGAHTLRIATRDVTTEGGAPAFVALACAADDRVVMKLPLANGTHVQRASLSVPAGCPAQALTLNLSPGDSPTGSGGTINALAID